MQLVPQPGERHNPPVVDYRLLSLNDLNLFRGDAHNFGDIVHRKNQYPAGNLHKQALNDSQRKREPDCEDGPSAGLCLNIDNTIQPSDLTAHNIHADPPAGDLADL
ncbi:hypothetical protein D3C73_1288040 [compost metagenome]